MPILANYSDYRPEVRDHGVLGLKLVSPKIRGPVFLESGTYVLRVRPYKTLKSSKVGPWAKYRLLITRPSF